MLHDINLIATIAAGFGFAMMFGLIAARLRMPPLLGYLLAGIVIGPSTPGFVGDIGLAGQLAEIGVMLLMFGVGLHFSIDDLLKVKAIAVPGAIVQIVVAVGLGALASSTWGWSLGSGLVFGLCLSVASTVVLLRALEARGQLQSVNGQIALGWLVVEDLVMVLVLVLIPALAGVPGGGAITELLLVLAKIVAFVVVMLVGGRRILPRILWWVAQTGSQELFRLGVTAVAIGVAFGAAKLFDVSFALGAFFAGMMLRESEFSHRAAEESLPLRDAFAVLFFVSVGMLFDPSILWREPAKLLAVVLIIVLGKTVAAMLLVLAFRYPLSTALTVGAALAQIGEFSFILAGFGVALGLLPEEGRSLVLAGALVSIGLNPALFKVSGSFPLSSRDSVWPLVFYPKRGEAWCWRERSCRSGSIRRSSKWWILFASGSSRARRAPEGSSIGSTILMNSRKQRTAPCSRDMSWFLATGGWVGRSAIASPKRVCPSSLPTATARWSKPCAPRAGPQWLGAMRCTKFSSRRTSGLRRCW